MACIRLQPLIQAVCRYLQPLGYLRNLVAALYYLAHRLGLELVAIPAPRSPHVTPSFLIVSLFGVYGFGGTPISWGVLLQDAQQVRTLLLAPWLMLSVAPVVVFTLAFNFLGDGLRDAADPYKS